MPTKQLSKKDILMQLAFLAIGIGLFIYVIQKFDFQEILATLKSAKVGPIVLVLIISLAGHFLRAYRWKLMMDETGKTNYWNLLFSMQLGYFVSLAIPRIGEFIKCFTTAETEKKPVSFVFGTVMAERIMDLLILIALFALCLFLYNEMFFQFWDEVKVGLLEMWESKKYFVLGGFALLVVIMLPSINKMTEGEKNELHLMEGLKSVFTMQNKSMFVASSLAIWLCYFLTSYVLFFCFAETSVLGLGEGFVTMISGTMSRMLPIQGGGIGAYHYVTEKLMTSFGVESKLGISYAILNHGIQFVFQIAVGIVSIIFLSRKVDLKNINKIKI